MENNDTEYVIFEFFFLKNKKKLLFQTRFVFYMIYINHINFELYKLINI